MGLFNRPEVFLRNPGEKELLASVLVNCPTLKSLKGINSPTSSIDFYTLFFSSLTNRDAIC
jgi:hypothetical protein